MTLTPTQVSSLAAERLQQQRQFFASGQSQDVQFRLEQLQRLKDAIQERSAAIVEAVHADLGRPEFEAYFEIAAIAEVNYAIKHLKSWVKPQTIRTGLDQFPSRGRIYPEPLGVVLIISPWNYPFQLSISPLVGAIRRRKLRHRQTLRTLPPYLPRYPRVNRSHLRPRLCELLRGRRRDQSRSAGPTLRPYFLHR